MNQMLIRSLITVVAFGIIGVLCGCSGPEADPPASPAANSSAKSLREQPASGNAMSAPKAAGPAPVTRGGAGGAQ